MLVNIEVCFDRGLNYILDKIATVNGNDVGTVKLQDGVYLIGHFSGNFLLGNYKLEQYPELPCCRGVCDNVDQVFDLMPIIKESQRKFVITVTPIHRSKQSKVGGWRWHKWGEYIGTQNPQCEYPLVTSIKEHDFVLVLNPTATESWEMYCITTGIPKSKDVISLG